MATTPDYSALENFLLESARRGVQLSGAPKRELTKALSGKDGKITLASLRGGKDTFKKAGGTDYLATIGRTYGSDQLSKEVKEKLKEKGFAEDSGYYVKPGQITGATVQKAVTAGFGEEDLRSLLADKYAQSQLDSEIAKFMGQGNYNLDPSTGRWKQKETVNILSGIPGDATSGAPSGTIPSGTPGSTVSSGIYAGINPDTASGVTPTEIDYTMIMDPLKLQARSGERLGLLQASLNEQLGRMETESAKALERMRSSTALQQGQLQAGLGSYLGRLEAGSAQNLGRMRAASELQQGRLQAGLGSYLGRLEAGSSQAQARRQSALSEQLARMETGSAQNLERMRTGSAERLGRLQSQTQKDLARSQQATELLGQKMGYGTEYDIAKVNRLAGLQQARIQQASNLYNLIPSAF